MNIEDTIASIATPLGNGGISIIRISGEKSFDIIKKIFKSKYNFDEYKSHSIIYGKIIYKDLIIDEVMVSKMNKPKTYTREDVIEINCHGGINITKNILEIVIKNGARLALPGEFTKRAFLNGRIDLSQAEAVIDIINSKNDLGTKAAVRQLEGYVSKEINKIRKKIIDFMAHIEVTLDYPEYDDEHIAAIKIKNESEIILKSLSNALESFEKGRIIKEGLNVAIVGKPNVGKSSLLNSLSGKDRAIVTNIPGTTRDILEETIQIQGIQLNLTDTAGIRNTEDIVESIGVSRAKKALNEADLVLFVIDASNDFNKEDERLLLEISNKNYIAVLNKSDLISNNEKEKIINNINLKNYIYVSAKTNEGITKLCDKIKAMYDVGDIQQNNEILITNIRHKNLIQKAIDSLKSGINAYEIGMSLDCIAIDIKEAADNLGKITGNNVTEDIVNSIFKNFCVGK